MPLWELASLTLRRRHRGVKNIGKPIRGAPKVAKSAEFSRFFVTQKLFKKSSKNYMAYKSVKI